MASPQNPKRAKTAQVQFFGVDAPTVPTGPRSLNFNVLQVACRGSGVVNPTGGLQ
jgi:hypothetical protein